jgi:hypothetical protein
VRTAATILLVSAATLAPSSTNAQTAPRVFVSVNGAQQTTRHSFADSFGFEVNRETGTTRAEYPIDGGLVVDGSVAVRVWRNLAAGVAFSNFTRDDPAETESEIPHPFFFDMPRGVAGSVDTRRTERAIHVQASYRVPVSRAIEVSFFGGPSFFRLEQDIVTDIEYDEAFPFDTAEFRRARTRTVDGSALGFNAGVDVAWMFSRHVGVGGLARFASASADVELGPGRARGLDAGGFTGGGGLRLAF